MTASPEKPVNMAMLFTSEHLRDRICAWLLPLLVVTFIFGWLQTFPLNKEIVLFDLWANLLLCLIAFIGYFFVVRTRINTFVVGWSFITLAIYVDFLDAPRKQYGIPASGLPSS